MIDLALDGGEPCDPGEAGAVGCTRDCAIDCPRDGVVDPRTRHCYFRAEQATAEFAAARGECSAVGAHLVTFESQEERSFVYARLGGVPAPRFWVGLVPRVELDGYASARDRVEPGWAANCPGCFAHLAPDASSIEGDAGDCVGDEPGGRSYFKVPCRQPPPPAPGSAPLGVVCEREPTGATFEPCAGGLCITIPRTLGTKRYLYVPVPVSAQEAADGCRALGGSLVMFDSAAEREAVLVEVQRFVSTLDVGAWVGLARAADAGTASFVWDDDAGEDARPPIWGREPQASMSAKVGVDMRAVVVVTLAEVDVQLARAVPSTEQRPYLCQY